MGVQVHFKAGNIIRNVLVVPKDKDNITQKSGGIYRCVTGWSVMSNT